MVTVTHPSLLTKIIPTSIIQDKGGDDLSTEEPKLYDSQQAMEYLNIGEGSFKYNVHKLGRLKPMNPGRRVLFFTQEALDDFLAWKNEQENAPAQRTRKPAKNARPNGRPRLNRAKWKIIGTWGPWHELTQEPERMFRFYLRENIQSGEKFYFTDLRLGKEVTRKIKVAPFDTGPQESYLMAQRMALSYDPNNPPEAERY